MNGFRLKDFPAFASSAMAALVLTAPFFTPVFTPAIVSAQFAGDPATDGQGPVQNGGKPGASSKLDRLRENVRRFTLPNGLRVIFYRRANAPVFSGQVWIRVGGVNEKEGQTGLAHLLEHMAFKGSTTLGTKNFAEEEPLLVELDSIMANPSAADAPKNLAETYKKLEALWINEEFSRIYEHNGADGLNAGTGTDYTAYFVNLPNVAFELWCWMETDRLLNPVFRQFYKEREVVHEERRSNYDDNPSGKMYEQMLATAFTVHPYRFSTIGKPEDLRRLSREELIKLYQTYYHPENMVISVVGDLDFETVRAMVEKYFGRLKRSRQPIPQVTAVEPPQTEPREATVFFDAEPQFVMAYHKPAFPNVDDAYFGVLHSYLSGGRSSLLYKELVVDKKLALDVGTSEAPGVQFPSVFYVRAMPAPGVAPERLRDEIQAVFDRLKTTPISEEDLQAVRRRARIGLLGGFNSNQGMAETMAESELIWGDWATMFKFYDLLEKATAGDVMRLAKTYLNVSNRTFIKLERPPGSGKQAPPGAAGVKTGTDTGAKK